MRSSSSVFSMTRSSIPLDTGGSRFKVSYTSRWFVQSSGGLRTNGRCGRISGRTGDADVSPDEREMRTYLRTNGGRLDGGSRTENVRGHTWWPFD
jgi:hypothetical protein